MKRRFANNAMAKVAFVYLIILIVVVPLIVGGRNVLTLVDGNSTASIDELKLLSPLELIRIAVI